MAEKKQIWQAKLMSVAEHGIETQLANIDKSLSESKESSDQYSSSLSNALDYSIISDVNKVFCSKLKEKTPLRARTPKQIVKTLHKIESENVSMAANDDECVQRITKEVDDFKKSVKALRIPGGFSKVIMTDSIDIAPPKPKTK